MDQSRGSKNNCWIRRVAEVVAFHYFVLLLAALAGKYVRDANFIQLDDQKKLYVMYSLGALFGLLCFFCAWMFIKPVTRARNPVNCMMLTVITFIAAILAFGVNFYFEQMDSFLGLGGALFIAVFLVFYASVCNNRDVSSWYLSIITMAVCAFVFCAVVALSISMMPRWDDISHEDIVFKVYGLVPNLMLIAALPFILPIFVRRRVHLCGETLEAAIHILYPWLIIYDPTNRCHCVRR